MAGAKKEKEGENLSAPSPFFREFPNSRNQEAAYEHRREIQSSSVPRPYDENATRKKTQRSHLSVPQKKKQSIPNPQGGGITREGLLLEIGFFVVVALNLVFNCRAPTIPGN